MANSKVETQITWSAASSITVSSATVVWSDGIRYQADSSSVTVGTDRFSGEKDMENGAAIHQFGGLAGRRSHRVKIPARPFLGFSAADRSATLDLLAKFLDK